jgi:CRISPR-associated endonuclease/helicase Cas3
VEGVAPEDAPVKPEKLALVWRGEENSKVGTEEMRPGDTVIVRSSEGGCDRFGWNPGCEETVRDIGDLCANARADAGGGRYRIRVHPLVVFHIEKEKQGDLRDVIRRREEDDIAEEMTELMASLPGLAEATKKVDWAKAKTYTEGGLMVMSRKFAPKVKAGKSVSPAFDETDENDTGSLTAQMSLVQHTAGVVGKARDFSRGCGLGESLAVAIVAAAERHDLGKCDERFQRLLDPLWDSKGVFLAKSDTCSPREYMRRRTDAGYPSGARHEFASAALAAAFASWPAGCDEQLALHLIGTHHGYGRALPPVWTDSDYEVRARLNGDEVAVRGAHRVGQLDSGWTDRYWAMTRRYGWWGLAYLEAVLRRADCVRSREEQEERG